MPKDPYKYFRVEAQELLDQLGQGALDLEKGLPAPDAAARLLRLAHTLKGAAGVVGQREIGDRAHALEDALTLVRDSPSSVPRDRIDLVLGLLDGIGNGLRQLTPAPAAESTTPDQPDQPALAFRPAIDDLDALLGGVVEAQVQLGALRLSLEHMGLGDGVDQMDRELRQVREAAERLRLAPASALFTFLERAVRDVARTLRKRVAFTAYGGDVRVDTVVLNVMQNALLQIVRNAVAHGIETGVDQRTAAGKRAEGSITLRVSQRGMLVSFACTDDGRGIDLEAVQRIARRKGVRLDGGTNTDPDELLRLLLKGGMSTSGAITDVSGRGIGLDIVREAAERLGGEATVRTDAGKGTTVELVVPLSLTSLHALMVEASGGIAAIPLDAVCASRRIAREEIIHTEQKESILFDGQAIPLASVAHTVSSAPAPSTSAKHSSAVFVRGQTGIAAFTVDRILGTAQVVVRPLPELVYADSVIAGLALDAVGDPQVVLDPDTLVARACQAITVAVEAAPSRFSVLVVDDSLTTRMLEQSILESAGFDVDLATSGEEGLAKARAASYSLFLVDVEMPGMDGFTFIERVRADPQLRDIPSVLVTSRASAQDRQRGQDVGAQAYVVKGEFDQGALLERIRTLVG
jgi:two-component system chemotaxis sensor kinase CheA